MGGARGRIEVDLGAVERNVVEVRNAIGPDRLIMAVVKKNAYGHGLVQVAERCVAAGANRLAVEEVAVAAKLRSAGVGIDIHLLSPPLVDEMDACIENNVVVAITDREGAVALDEAAAKAGRKVRGHILVDTGMGRFGPFPGDAIDLAPAVASLENVELEGAFTHFHSSHDTGKCGSQLKAFLESVDTIRGKGIGIPVLHAAACGAVWRMPEALLDMVRVGLCVVGIYNDDVMRGLVTLHPAMKVTSTITFVKEVPAGTPVGYNSTYVTEKPAVVATIPFGYGSGYHFSLSNRGWVGLGGRKAPVLGRVTMDYIMVDVTDVPEAQPGAEVAILGRPGPEAEELAELAGVVPHEIVCHFGQRAAQEIHHI
jgi:alanine racemase